MQLYYCSQLDIYSVNPHPKPPWQLLHWKTSKNKGVPGGVPPQQLPSESRSAQPSSSGAASPTTPRPELPPERGKRAVGSLPSKGKRPGQRHEADRLSVTRDEAFGKHLTCVDQLCVEGYCWKKESSQDFSVTAGWNNFANSANWFQLSYWRRKKTPTLKNLLHKLEKVQCIKISTRSHT